MKRATVVLACLLAATPAAAETPREAAVTALIESATTAANEGRFAESLRIADQAVALADRTLPRRNALRFEALRRRAVTMTYVDETVAPAAFDRLGEVGDEVYGATSFEARFSRFKGAQWKYSARVKGFGLPELAAAADAVAVIAKGDEQVTLAAQALAILANYTSNADIVAARPIAERAIALADSLGHVVAAERGQVYSFTATVAMRDDRAADALALAKKAEAVFVADQGKNSHHLLTVLGTQADAARRLGDLVQAEAVMRRALTIVDARPQLSATYSATVLLDYARFLTERGRYDLAFPLAERAAAVASKLPPTAAYPQSTTIAVGKIYQAAGQHDDALRHFRRALTMTEAAGGASLFQATVLIEMGRSEFALGDMTAAQATAERAMGVFDKAALPGSSARGRARMLLADVADARGDAAVAAALYAQAVVELGGLGPDPAYTAAARVRHAAMLARIGRLDEAGWREARAGGDALIGSLGRQARIVVGDTATLSVPPGVLDGALDVAWARAHPVEVGAR